MIYLKKFKNSHKGFLFAFAGAASALMFAGCSNDNAIFDTPADTSTVCFSVGMEAPGRADANSRAAAGRLCLRGSDPADTLSVRVSVTDGITSPDAQSRAAAVSTGDFYDAMGLIAYKDTVEWDDATSQVGFMYDQEVRQDRNWATDYNWPGRAYHVRFFAYAPYGNPAISLSPVSDAGLPVLSYTVPADVTEQIDLVTALTPDMPGASSSAVSLTFGHDLTKVHFLADEILNGGTITSIGLRNVYSSASCKWGGDWEGHADIADFTQNPDFSTKGQPETIINDASATFMMMPQTLPADAAIEVVYTDRDGTEHTLSASIAGGVWPKGKTVTYRISYSNISIVPPLRNVSGETTIISNGEHELKLDFSNSVFDEMEVRVYKRLVNSDLQNHAAAYAANENVQPLSGTGFASDEYGEVLATSIVTADNSELAFTLGENTHENMLWQLVVQYRLPAADGTYPDLWEDAGTRLYQDAKPVEGQDWIFYYDDKQQWTTKYQGEIIYKSTLLMKTPQADAVAIGNLAGADWWQCDHATNAELRDAIVAVQTAFETANRTGAIAIPDKEIVDVHNVSGTYGAARILNYVPGERDAIEFRALTNGGEQGNNPSALFRGVYDINVKAFAVGEVAGHRLSSRLDNLQFNIYPEAHRVYEYGSTTNVSDKWMTVLPKCVPITTSPCVEVLVKPLFGAYQSQDHYTTSDMIYPLDIFRDSRACAFTGDFANVIPLLCINPDQDRCLGTYKATNGGYPGTQGTYDRLDTQATWEYFGSGLTERVQSAYLSIPFEFKTEIDRYVAKSTGALTAYSPYDTAIDWEQHSSYTLSVDEADTDIWVRKPYSGGTVPGFEVQQ